MKSDMSVAHKLKVLFATSEVAPLVKTGGLADVSASLPVALAGLDVDIRVLVPGYPQIMAALKSKSRVATLPVFSGIPPAHLVASKLPSGVPLFVIDSAMYQRAGGPYQDDKGTDWPDNDLRFGLLSYTAALLSMPESPLAWKPDLLHCNDWQTGLAPVYLHYLRRTHVPSVMTIHNLSFQGIFPSHTTSRLGLPPEAFAMDGVEYYGNLSFLKGGLQFADRITTVSSGYAQEIQSEPLGMGLQGLLANRREALTGIQNGIDVDAWDPESDPYIERYYTATRPAGKQDNKRALQARMGLTQTLDIPLFGVISRMTHQKGVDLIADIAEQLLALPAQLVVLGAGEAPLQKRFRDLALRNPGKIAAHIGFDEGLSHQIEAGSDLFLMPSRFEPSGLNQMYSQRYGTPPIVHATGGLRDSVTDCTAATLKDRTATGFVFAPLDKQTLLETCRRAVEVYRQPRIWRQLQKNGMNRDFSWDARAKQYLEVYRSLLPG
jgi:starch synthase